MVGVTWLHLSDWHQNGMQFDRRVVRDALKEDIENRSALSEKLSTVDFVVFSGDLSYRGKSEEFQKAREQLLDPLLEACGQSQNPDRFFIVPGNHDSDRDSFNQWQKEFWDSCFLNSYDCLTECLEQVESRERILEPFQAFTSFVQDYNGQDLPNYGSVRILNIRDKKIALFGINSALACGRHINEESKEIDDRGFVFVGEPQIYDRLSSISDADIKIAVLHHTFDWLNGNDLDRVRRRLMEKFDFILQGHQHKQDVSIINGLIGSSTIIPAGASYNHPTLKDPQPTYAYNFVHFDFDSRNFTVFLRRWSETRKKWVEDVNSYEHGIFESRDSVRQLSPSPGSLPLPIMITTSADNLLQGSGYQSTKEAVEAANPGDTITIRAGAFKENIQIDKSLTIKGAGASNTFIDGSQAGSVFKIGENEADIDVTLSGIAIKEGSGSLVLVNDNDANKYICGGGILNYGRLTVTDCTIFNNTAFNGGGIFSKGTVNINNGTTITQNIANNGGGIFNNCGSRNTAKVNLNEGSSIENNRANQNGAGIYSGGYRVGRNTLNINNGCNISGNIAGNSGGGIWIISEGTLNMNGGVISNNKGWTGGGIFSYGSYANLRGGSIHNNIALNGAGIVNGGGWMTVDGSLIYGNIANKNDYGYGGGILNSGILTLTSGSIEHNTAFTGGGGIYTTNSPVGKVLGRRQLVHDNYSRKQDDILPEIETDSMNIND